MRGLRVAVAALAMAGGLALASDARAQGEFPTRPVRLVVPFAAGGNTDLVARVAANGMSDNIGQQVIVENKTGSGSLVASEFVAKAPADGYTLLNNTVAHAVSPALFSKLPFDPVKSFAPVALVARSPLILVISAKLGPKDMAGLLALLRKEPGQHTFGTGGTGAAEHLAGELLKQTAKVDIVHVPYRGAAPAVNDLLTNQISMMITPISAVQQHIQSGALIGIAVSTKQRVKFMPDVPTIAESVPDYEAYTWNAIYAPAQTPKPVIDKLNASVNKALGTKAVQQRILDLGNEPDPGSPPEALAAFLDAEMKKWTSVIQTAGIKPE
jgi:tripartite-type tricarboxylate transporter receptor subunit TctC